MSPVQQRQQSPLHSTTSPNAPTPSPNAMSPSNYTTISPSNPVTSPVVINTMMELATSPSPPAIVSSSYKNDPTYISLKQEEQNLTKNIGTLNKQLAEIAQNVKTAINTIQKDRFEKKKIDLSNTIAKQQQRLQQVLNEIAAKEK